MKQDEPNPLLVYATARNRVAAKAMDRMTVEPLGLPVDVANELGPAAAILAAHVLIRRAWTKAVTT